MQKQGTNLIMNTNKTNTKKILRLSSPLLILFVALVVAVMPVIETFAAINRTSYQYGVTSCTEGSDLQKERCKDQSAEAMAYRIHKGIKGTSPTNPLYNTWVTNFKNSTANSKPIDLAILVAETTTSNNQTYLVDLYQNFLCKTANQEAVAIAGWKSQLDGNKQTRAQIALNLAKRPAAMDCMRAGFLDFLASNPPENPTLGDVSVTCTTTVGESCTVAAPQYCLSAFVTQPANGTSTVTGGNIVYTPNGNSAVEENYAHLRQNGTATAKCNVKVVFEEPQTPEEMFNIAIIGAGYSDQTSFNQKADSYISTIDSLLMTPIGLKDSVVFHRAYTNNSLGCVGGMAVGETDVNKRTVTCDTAQIDGLIADNAMPADKILVIFNQPDKYGGAAWGGGPYAFVSTGSDDPYWGVGEGRVGVHEFGHALSLVDEYIYPGVSASPADLGRSHGQCIYPYNSAPLFDGTWRSVSGEWLPQWQNLPDVNWTSGCSVPEWYRPSPISMMGDWSSPGFNTVSLQVVKDHIQAYINDPNLPLADVYVECTVQRVLGSSCSIPAPEYCLPGSQGGTAGRTTWGKSFITNGNITYEYTGKQGQPEAIPYPGEKDNFSYVRFYGSGFPIASCNVSVTLQ